MNVLQDGRKTTVVAQVAIYITQAFCVDLGKYGKGPKEKQRSTVTETGTLTF